MLFWVASRACKAIKTKVISIWRDLGAFYKETWVTSIPKYNDIYQIEYAIKAIKVSIYS